MKLNKIAVHSIVYGGIVVKMCSCLNDYNVLPCIPTEKHNAKLSLRAAIILILTLQPQTREVEKK